MASKRVIIMNSKTDVEKFAGLGSLSIQNPIIDKQIEIIKMVIVFLYFTISFLITNADLRYYCVIKWQTSLYFTNTPEPDPGFGLLILLCDLVGPRDGIDRVRTFFGLRSFYAEDRLRVIQAL